MGGAREMGHIRKYFKFAEHLFRELKENTFSQYSDVS